MRRILSHNLSVETSYFDRSGAIIARIPFRQASMSEIEPIHSSAILLTQEGAAKLQQELVHLSKVKRQEIAERLRDSKQHGEFAEDNSELDEVKFEQALVESRIAELKTIFAGAHVLEHDQISTSEVGVGTYVTVKDAERSIEFEVRLVSSFEADPDRDFISNESPMGIALMGLKPGEIAEFEAPAGKLKYEVVKIKK